MGGQPNPYATKLYTDTPQTAFLLCIPKPPTSNEHPLPIHQRLGGWRSPDPGGPSHTCCRWGPPVCFAPTVNSIRDEGASALADCLQRNTTLTTISLGGAGPSPAPFPKHAIPCSGQYRPNSSKGLLQI